MEGLIEEGQALMEEDFDESTLDAGLIGAAQRVEHYEMAACGVLVSWARLLGHEDAAVTLEQTLEEEKAADDKLTTLAEGGINKAAVDALPDEDSDQEKEEDDENEEKLVTAGGCSATAGKSGGGAGRGAVPAQPRAGSRR